MKYVDELRDPRLAQRFAAGIRAVTTRPWTIMEVCGGQTHTIARYAIESLLPAEITVVHGPGCPVCVTPLTVLDHAMSIAETPGVVLCTYGDMLRVPSSRGDLLAARGRGADVRVVLSPLDAVRMAIEQPAREHVFFSVGFETTAPAAAAAIELADSLRLANFSVLAAHVRVPPALDALFADPASHIDGALAAGHVCAVMGTSEYPEICERFGVPIVVTGFEPADILEGVLLCVTQLEAGRREVEVQYRRAVRPDGSPLARAAIERAFTVADRPWRGLGVIPRGGLRISDRYARLDAERRFERPARASEESRECRAADVLRGALKPTECPQFGRGCTPERPLGAPMVSTEGACAAFHRYRVRRAERSP